MVTTINLPSQSFTATDRVAETIAVCTTYVNERIAPLAQKGDLCRFIV